jgi:hypothetical protein
MKAGNTCCWIARVAQLIRAGSSSTGRFTWRRKAGWPYTIDFDLRKSITLRQRNKPNPQDNDYKLPPTLRILDTEIASSFLFGTVTATCTEPANPADPSGCAVYVTKVTLYPMIFVSWLMCRLRTVSARVPAPHWRRM